MVKVKVAVWKTNASAPTSSSKNNRHVPLALRPIKSDKDPSGANVPELGTGPSKAPKSSKTIVIKLKLPVPCTNVSKLPVSNNSLSELFSTSETNSPVGAINAKPISLLNGEPPSPLQR